jgi:hypothetical protein
MWGGTPADYPLLASCLRTISNHRRIAPCRAVLADTVDQGFRIVNHTGLDHPFGAAQIRHIGQRIGIEQYNIGQFAGRDCTKIRSTHCPRVTGT